MSNGGRHVVSRVAGVGLGVQSVLAWLAREPSQAAPADASTATDGTTRPGGDAAGAGTTPTAFRRCRKPMATGFRCYEPDGHPGACNPEACK